MVINMSHLQFYANLSSLTLTSLLEALLFVIRDNQDAIPKCSGITSLSFSDFPSPHWYLRKQN